MRLLHLFLILAICVPCRAQRLFERLPHDKVWLLGGSTIRLDFEDALQISPDRRFLSFDATNASICNRYGELQLYTNGIKIGNFETLVENGIRINPGTFSDDWAQVGYPLDQGALFLQQPESDSLYHLVYAEEEYIRLPSGTRTSRVRRLHHALVDMAQNGGLGLVVEKDFPLIIDSLDAGKISAIRHGNGRDWWVLMPYQDGVRHHRFLLSPNGISSEGITENRPRTYWGIGQTVFSPKGNIYANYTLHRFNQNFLAIYDFDRCTGQPSNARIISDTLFSFSGGAGISENGRFLYQSSFQHLYQIDLLADSLHPNLIAEYDGYHELPDYPDILWTTFSNVQLTPDGRIFMNMASSSRHLHVVQSPNKRGAASRFEQRAIRLPDWNQRGLPNFPYYGLGPLDGSPCDTLGIDNPVPEAAFEYTVQDSALQVEFFDGSHYMPAYHERLLDDRIGWRWDFGDGSVGDTTRFPVHTFPADGSYEVCLTVSNVTGVDTYCEDIFVGVTSVAEVVESDVEVRLWPNPVGAEALHISLRLRQAYGDRRVEGISKMPFTFTLRDAHGRVVRQSTAAQSPFQVVVADLPAGMYFYSIRSAGRQLAGGKIAKLE